MLTCFLRFYVARKTETKVSTNWKYFTMAQHITNCNKININYKINIFLTFFRTHANFMIDYILFFKTCFLPSMDVFFSKDLLLFFSLKKLQHFTSFFCYKFYLLVNRTLNFIFHLFEILIQCIFG